MADNLHSGHRERVRKRFLENGIDGNTPQHEILEFLLFYCLPRVDTNELAHKLLDKFGTLAGVFDAPEDEILSIKGIPKNCVALFKMLVPIARVYMEHRYDKPQRFNNISDLGDMLLQRYFGFTEEVFSVVSLDGEGRFLGFDIIEKGDISSVGVSSRSIVKTILRTQATCAIICHNHPRGFALPSGEDVALTETIAEALRHISVRLIDHIIIAGDDYISMFQSAKYRHLFG